MWHKRETAAGATHGDIVSGGFYQGPSSPVQNLGSGPRTSS